MILNILYKIFSCNTHYWPQFEHTIGRNCATETLFLHIKFFFYSALQKNLLQISQILHIIKVKKNNKNKKNEEIQRNGSLHVRKQSVDILKRYLPGSLVSIAIFLILHKQT